MVRGVLKSMDKLLQQKPQVVANEKAVLFSFIDRFINSVEAYRKEYNDITNSRNADLQRRESDSRNALDKLAAAQAKEKKDHLDKLNTFIATSNGNIESYKNRIREELERIEADIAKYEKDQKAAIDQAYQMELLKVEEFKKEGITLEPLISVDEFFN